MAVPSLFLHTSFETPTFYLNNTAEETPEAAEATETPEATEGSEEAVDPTFSLKSPDAETAVIFPTIKDNKFPAGGLAVALISFHNKGVKVGH